MKIITISSGKGGVGKTNIAVNLAVSLASKGYKTCLFDADIGLANVNILMGIAGRYTLEDVISGKRILKEIIIKNWNGIDIIPGSSGVEQFEILEKKELDSLINQFSKLDEYDYIIVDTGAGISKAVISFCLASSILLLAIVPEPTSLTDAYSLLKVLKVNNYGKTVNIIVNRSKTENYGKKVFEKFQATVNKYIDFNLKFFGVLGEDEKVAEAVSQQSPFILKYPECRASKNIRKISDILINSDPDNHDTDNSFDSFIQNCSDFFQSRLKLIKSGKEPKESASKTQFKQAESVGSPDNTKDKSFDSEVISLIKRLVEQTEKMSEDIEFIKKQLSQNQNPKNTEKIKNIDFEKYVKK